MTPTSLALHHRNAAISQRELDLGRCPRPLSASQIFHIDAALLVIVWRGSRRQREEARGLMELLEDKVADRKRALLIRAYEDFRAAYDLVPA